MTGSLISRQAAIDMFNRLADDPWNANANTTWSKAYGYAAEMIEELPSAEPKWIPVTERLPEDEVNVLVTDDAGGLATIEIDCMFTREDTEEREWFTSQRVTAWMPLPEPWRGGDE